MDKQTRHGADVIVDSLTNLGVEYAFGIPGAKIDRVFDTLEDKGPKLIVTRHEQNAAFMAAGIGRLTGEPGVVLATSGPGASNLATGLVTATAEGDPVLAIAGQVKRSDLTKLTHQSMKNAALFEPITKFSAEVEEPENLSEVIANAYRAAKSPKQGASFISIPQDVTDAEVTLPALAPLSAPKLGPANAKEIEKLAQKIKDARLPVLLLGMRASSPEVTAAVRELVAHADLPVVETFQGAGIISRELEDNFFGRVGLFRNQPGDMLLKRSDLVIAVGYDPIEYEARNWNAEKDARIIVIDDTLAEIDTYFQPQTELTGDMAETLMELLPHLEDYQLSKGAEDYLQTMQDKLRHRDVPPEADQPHHVHPLAIIEELQRQVTDEMTVTVDVGSHYIWMARHFRSYEPRHLLFSNGMQTLGVALPWAISAALVRPNTQIVSVSGDGGFLFSGQELETAVRLGLSIVHIIWNDGAYNMVEFQEEMKYERSAGVDFGAVDFVQYAEAFGAKGLRVETADQLASVLKEAFAAEGPVVVDIPVDYSDNHELGKTILPDQFY
ncbi:acetolactate synthase AlsS [Pisciglobus halotolerans]|uniref:Acetolactate synthase, large subunit n=1 Tax=Pisciglobus halotolerans TaxID=745365 RepID=A0A1I3BND2_9LACT|nr:acetolactate synthase AlsS [Pisciglobus halotolerans]SFH63844.1 acetolactate synthase, large subunit [Pisciglobus halotolerans]